jgi:hypothetical protein
MLPVDVQIKLFFFFTFDALFPADQFLVVYILWCCRNATCYNMYFLSDS